MCVYSTLHIKLAFAEVQLQQINRKKSKKTLHHSFSFLRSLHPQFSFSHILVNKWSSRTMWETVHFFSLFRHFFFIGCVPPNCNVLAHLWCERMSATHGSGYFSWLRSNCLFFSACLFADIRAVVYMQRSFLVRSQVSFITAMYATFGAFFISISNEFIIFFAACIFSLVSLFVRNNTLIAMYNVPFLIEKEKIYLLYTLLCSLSIYDCLKISLGNHTLYTNQIICDHIVSISIGGVRSLHSLNNFISSLFILLLLHVPHGRPKCAINISLLTLSNRLNYCKCFNDSI